MTRCEQIILLIFIPQFLAPATVKVMLDYCHSVLQTIFMETSTAGLPLANCNNLTLLLLFWITNLDNEPLSHIFT